MHVELIKNVNVNNVCYKLYNNLTYHSIVKINILINFGNIIINYFHILIMKIIEFNIIMIVK